MAGQLPNGGLQLQSTLDHSGVLTITLADALVRAPGENELVVKVEAAPINPSDIMPLLAGGDPAQAKVSGQGDRPVVTLQLPDAVAAASAGRVGYPMPVGLEGAGEVVAAGSKAEALIGKRVAFLSLGLGSLGQYCTVSLTECAPLPGDVTSAQGADVFCNPLTALAMVETLHQTGQSALVHTAAASNLGQMLVRICQEDGVPLVNVVRREEQAELLRGMGAEHVCNSSVADFEDTLAEAVAETGATAAFDAIGGGEMASQLLSAMEKAAAGRLPKFSPYGSSEMKRVYVYGGLDLSATQLPRDGYGMLWAVEGWAMPPILERAGAERAAELTQRVLDNIVTTFASNYGHEITLAQALEHETMLGYCRKATGEKYLVRPWG